MNKLGEHDWLVVPQRLEELFYKYADELCEKVTQNPDAEYWELNVNNDIIKIANEKQTFTPLSPFASVGGPVSKLMGGPNALTLALLGSALGAGVGGLGGWLTSKLMPDHLDNRLARNLSIIGLLAGAAPGVAIGARQISKHGLPGIFKQWPPKPDTSVFDPVVEKMTADNIHIPSNTQTKTAAIAGAGAILPTIDEPGWRRTVLTDPYLKQKEKAVAAGLPFGASLSRNRRFVSPMDIARISVGAGVGAITGKAIGDVASGFLGLTNKAKKDIQQVGLLAGLVRSAIGTL